MTASAIIDSRAVALEAPAADEPVLSSAAPARRRRRLDIVLVALIGLGLAGRMWVATVTDNADARTLAWGSALVATGSSDPYRDIIRDSAGDPIPLGGIRSLSLAQGYIGVTAGAVPMWVGDRLGLIHLGDRPDGHRFHLGELFAYKLSYLLPELGILGSIVLLVRPRRRRLAAFALWATTPLVIFTWGQGMPDTWTVMFLLLGAAGFRAIDRADSVRSALTRYWVVAGTISVGAFGTKLIPAVLAVPFVVAALRDHRLTLRDRSIALAAVPVTAAVAALPYLASPYMVANIFVRFEFDMLYGGAGISTLGGMRSAQWGLMGIVAVTAWLASARNPWSRIEPWIVTCLLLVTMTSGIIPHLLSWALAAIILLCSSSPTAATVVSATTGATVGWHLLTYDWLAGLLPFSISRELRPGNVAEWVATTVPMHAVVGGAIASALTLGAVFASWTVVRRSSHLSPPRARVALAVGLGTWVWAVGCLIVAAVVAMTTPVPTWDLAYGGYPSGATLPIRRDAAWTSEPIDADLTVDAVSFRVDRSSQPSLDELRFRLIRNGETIATASEPVWTAEPESDVGPVVLSFGRPVDARGAVVRIDRVTTAPTSAELAAAPDGPGNGDWPLLALEARTRDDGVVRPAVELRSVPTRDFPTRLRTHLLSPVRMIAIPLAALGLAVAISYLATVGAPILDGLARWARARDQRRHP